MSKSFLYSEIAENLASQIRNGIIREGDKLPSVRMLCAEYEISMNTAKRVFLELESQSLIYAKPQSGYFASKLSYKDLPLPGESNPILLANHCEPNDILQKVYANIGREDILLLSYTVAYGDMLPISQLKKEIVQATRALPTGGVQYDRVEGNANLRRMVAMRSLTWGANLKEEDLITTNGGMNAVALCLMALSKPGDTVAIESPCYPGILQLALGLGLKVFELPTHPRTGIKIEALKEVIDKIDICILISNYNTPVGSCMPDENKKEVVELLASQDIPLIEDDVYGDLCFTGHRPNCCKSFDTTGNVLWCSSISKTLAPGFRVGWVAPGKYKDKVLNVKLVHSISSSSLEQEAVANFLKSGKYDKHLKNLRQKLYLNYQNYARVIQQSFPKDVKISQPQGGLSLWIEFGDKIDTIELYDAAIKRGISIAPGRMFTLQDQYNNSMRLCFGVPWNAQLESKLKQIGILAKQLQRLNS
ncbi:MULTISPECIES: PLP-dependent aminotransferase family protein [Myroides]|uniref:Aminotransferase class I/II-fold pyridoxal phosphate-dependent enzyme n=1 Tax=Myroides albus TaxID=2562892 RepID=A0A6I3LJ47_9FLAO|nr:MULTISPECIES: PLP-dependent aminotransferase family protein [Myroides]MTG98273.1 aminotransferase class I/II-fold pyridoxal phosphate-dependent enzyme [Myroides albus]MVX35399.1 aminotransferase class I/II-fold pyridoxal phosphate-dependent enzyme [Myroides sp. LoEW2-1]UVD79001.1 PLP-dependent aminotransferase family protein [Myroides albus]